MRIAHVTSELCRRSAGLGAAVSALSMATTEAGNEVRVFGLSSPEWRDGDSAIWTGAPATVFDSVRWSGAFGYAPEMLSELLEFRPDLVHLHGLWTYPSIAAYHWSQATGGPLAVSAHGMLTPVSLAYNRRRKIIARKLFQDRVLLGANILHATSEDEVASYQAFDPLKRIEMIPLGISVQPRPVSHRDRDRRRVLFLGRLHHQKGIDWLIEAWIRIERDFPDWELSIVGPVEQSFTRELDRLKRASSGKRISFGGPLYGNQKDRYVADSDLFVMPSRSENFGLAAAEALSMEVPVIATKGTPWSGLVTADAGWWIDPSVEALRAALGEAMRLSSDRLQDMGRNGRRWIDTEFSWTVIAAKWQRVYQCLINREKI